MNYRVEEIESQLRSSEDSGWEFKQVEFAGDRPKRPTRGDWANEIAAFANAAGGVVLAGVADDGTVIGMSRAQIANLDSLLVEVSTDTIKPPVRIRTHHKELSDGKLVLLAEVPQSDSVHESPGGSYIRVGGSKRLMGSDEQLRLAQRRSQARFLWFDKQPVPETGFKTLAEALWKPLLSAEGATEPEAALGKLALSGRRRGRGASRYRRRRVVVHSESGTMASQRLHHRDQIPGQRSCIRPDRFPGDHRPAERTDHRRRCLRRQTHAGRCTEGSGPFGSAPVQRKSRVRGIGQRSCPSRLFHEGKQDSPLHVR